MSIKNEVFEDVKSQVLKEHQTMALNPGGNCPVPPETIGMRFVLSGKHAIAYRALKRIAEFFETNVEEMNRNIFKRGVMKDYEYQINKLKNW